MIAPKLRFSEFKDEWESKKLGKICSHFQSGKSITSQDISENAEFPVFGGNGLRGYTDSFTHEGKFALVGRQGALCGNVNLVNGKNYISEHAIAIQANQENDTDWLAYWLDKMNLNRFSESSAQAGLAVNKLVKFDITISPIKAEQTKIAEFLSAVDDKISQLSRELELLNQYKKGVMQKIFSQEIRFKNDNGEDFGEWETLTLGKIGVFKSGIGFPEKFQGGLEGIPFYKVSDMNLLGNDYEMKSANNYVDNLQVKILKAKIFEKKSIIFAKVGAAIFLERKRIAVNFLIDNNMMAFTPSQKNNLNFIKLELTHYLNSTKHDSPS